MLNLTNEELHELLRIIETYAMEFGPLTPDEQALYEKIAGALHA